MSDNVFFVKTKELNNINDLVKRRTVELRYFIEEFTNGELIVGKSQVNIAPIRKTPVLVSVDFPLWTKEHSSNMKIFDVLHYGNVNYENSVYFGQQGKDYSMPHFEKEDVFLDYTIGKLLTIQANLPKDFTKTAEMLGQVIENIENYLSSQPKKAHIKKERYPKVKPLKKDEPENGEER